MLIVTTENIPDKKIELLGIVRGSHVQARNPFHDMLCMLKSIVGVSHRSYTLMLSEARNEATRKMEQQAMLMGADAIIGVNYTNSMVMQNVVEVMAYGTAVKFLEN